MKAEIICHNPGCASVVEDFDFHHHMLVAHGAEAKCPACGRDSVKVLDWRPDFHRFALGNITMTPGAEELLAGEAQSCRGRAAVITLTPLLDLHAQGRWGDVDEHDKKINDSSIPDAEDPSKVLERMRVLSSWLVDGEKLWIITEAGRHATTALLPSEY
jgi:hypothetical protein